MAHNRSALIERMQLNRRAFLAAGAGAMALRAQDNEDLRRKIAADWHRPQYHIVPPAYFLNDPNGPFFWKGKYHMFYQYAPGGEMFSTKYWYHVVSEDLVHWNNLAVAIATTLDIPDKNGSWWCTAEIHNGVATIAHTDVSYDRELESAYD